MRNDANQGELGLVGATLPPDGKFCMECGSAIRRAAELCPHCGVRQPAAPFSMATGQVAAPNGKTRLAAALVALLLGGLGAHRFYLGQARGLLYFFPFMIGVITLLDSESAGFIFILPPILLSIYESIVFFTMNDATFSEKYGAIPPRTVRIGRLLLLTILTFGIYAAFRFYKAGETYEELAGTQSKFRGFFWAYVVGWVFVAFFSSPLASLAVNADEAGVETGLLLTLFGVMFAIALADVVLGACCLLEIIRLRNAFLIKAGVDPRGQPSAATHVVFWGIGNLVPLLWLFYLYFFFSEFNRIVELEPKGAATEAP